jgi:undecaprenyl-diphosphatase
MLLDLLKSAILGIVEGLTEFLPVSSTAHLLITSHLLDFSSIKNDLFEIIIQLGAILAVCLLYRQKIFVVLLNFKQKNEQKFLLNLILSFLPAAIIGGLFHDLIKKIFFSDFVIAIALIVGGIVMIAIDRKPRESRVESLDNITPKNAFLIGLFQCLAMIPGVSRSGATIIGGMLLGLNRKIAAEFSFFLAIPTIGAASCYDLYKNAAQLSSPNILLIFVGLLTSFLSAILVIKWFVSFVSKHNFVPFGYYRIAAGALILLFLI